MGLKFNEISINAENPTALGVWWAKVLGWQYDVDPDGDVFLYPPAGLKWSFLRVPDKRVVENRIHFDFRPTTSKQRSTGCSADPEGKEFCVLAEP
jgi:hypothetical protein